MASATISSNSVAAAARSGSRASSSVRRTSRSNSGSLMSWSPLSATVAHAVSRNRARPPAVQRSRPSAPDSDGGLTATTSRPTTDTAMNADRTGPRRISLTAQD